MRLCLSISDYHPKSWNPAWSVSTILTGLLSFMVSDESTAGSLMSSDAVKRQLAKDSRSWNLKNNRKFVEIFPEEADANRTYIKDQLQAATDSTINGSRIASHPINSFTTSRPNARATTETSTQPSSKAPSGHQPEYAKAWLTTRQKAVCIGVLIVSWILAARIFGF